MTLKIAVLTGMLFVSQCAFAGSVSGGGGGTLPGDRVEAADVTQAAAESRIVIEAWLKGVESWLVVEDGTTKNVWYHDYDKMFAAGTDVFKLLNEVPFRIVSSGACHDLSGGETDASANTDVAGGICISISRIQPKVSFANYRAEIAALILHEVSHLYGSDEPEAVSIQKLAVRFFAGKAPADIQDWNFRLIDSLQSLSSMLQIINSSLESGARIPCENLGDLHSVAMSAFHDLGDGGSSMYLTRESETEYYWQLSTRFMAMRDFLCTQPGFENERFRQDQVERFNTIWGADSTLTADQYFKRAVKDNSEFNRYPLISVIIKKYVSPSQIAPDLESANKDIARLRALLQSDWKKQFSFGRP